MLVLALYLVNYIDHRYGNLDLHFWLFVVEVNFKYRVFYNRVCTFYYCEFNTI